MHERHECRYQRLLAQEYDRKLKEAKRKGKIRFNVHETVDGQTIDVHASQSSLLGRESSTPSVSTSGFNYNDFVVETGHSAASGTCPLSAASVQDMLYVHECSRQRWWSVPYVTGAISGEVWYFKRERVRNQCFAIPTCGGDCA